MRYHQLWRKSPLLSHRIMPPSLSRHQQLWRKPPPLSRCIMPSPLSRHQQSWRKPPPISYRKKNICTLLKPITLLLSKRRSVFVVDPKNSTSQTTIVEELL
ncbi:hypothetical protein ABFS83_10G112300 [Erythranthe nasuta]